MFIAGDTLDNIEIPILKLRDWI